MAIVSKFFIKESFTITMAGFVVVGEVVEGEVKRGNQLTIDTGSEKVTLTIHMVDLPGRGGEASNTIGLRFSQEPEHISKMLTGVKVPQQLVDIISESE
jgi:selenocysteine-specific translation elongation factor